MKKYLLAAVAAGAVLAGSTGAFAEAVKLQLKWVTQAQFAGYYVAQAKGFYKDAGLEVTILPGGPDINPQQVLAGGGADVVIDWMPSALATREKGSKVVNIAQPFKKSGMMLTCRKDSGITKPEEFKGKTLGVWFYGNEYPFLSWMSQLGLHSACFCRMGSTLKPCFSTVTPSAPPAVARPSWLIHDRNGYSLP